MFLGKVCSAMASKIPVQTFYRYWCYIAIASVTIYVILPQDVLLRFLVAYSLHCSS